MTDLTADPETRIACGLPRHALAPQPRLGQAAALIALHSGNTLAGKFLTHRALLSVSSAFLLMGLVMTMAVDRPLPFGKGLDFALALGVCLAMAGIAVLAYRIAHAAFDHRPRATARMTQSLLFSPRWTNALPALLSLTVLVAVMNAIVAALPELSPHSQDARLIALDRALHLGLLPHEITHALAGSAALTALLDMAYQASFVWVLLFYVWIAFARQDTLHRQQFLVTLSLTWVSGAIIMVLVSSAGPAFMAHLTPGTSPYADLFTRLAAIDAETSLWSLGLQQAHAEALGGTSAGAHFAAIAAMPSLTCASLTLVALTAFRVDPRLGAAATTFAIVAGVAAVHLGWNYAVDCYAGVVLALAVWKAVGWGLERSV